jgi:Tetratricopeptide repeat/Doubled CXXCH motif (Paired_CXXCH_1)
MPRRRNALLFAAVLVAVGSLMSLLTWRTSRELGPRLTGASSPYMNTRLGVKYLGDEACIRCHGEIAGSYRRHPMGRSVAPIAPTSAIGGESETAGRPLFEAQGFEYAVENRDGHVIHKETRRDATGRLTAQNEGEVRFKVGSGRLGIAYLIDRDGFLFQSPIAWYARERRWDLPPGYQKSNTHFDRPIMSTCLFCHANRTLPVEGTANRYQPPIFQGHAIGCERCHGPGELHATNPKMVDGRDLTIVNPARLEPSLRDAVCEQCHLNGERRVLRAGRRDDDFRPGLPFHRFWTVLERPTGSAENRFVGQFEQMRQSGCSKASAGRLGCISCHDPHRLPEPEERVSYFRDRCLECHAKKGCSLPESGRTSQGRGDDCVRCHMPRLSSSSIIHVAETNHRIPRQAENGDRPLFQAADLRGDRRPWVNFHRDLMDDRDLAETDRDMALIVSRDGREGAAFALPLLEQGLLNRPDDVPAWEAKGFALGSLGRGEEAMAAFRRALSIEPNRESALTGAAYVAAQVARRDDSLAYWNRAIAISPWRSDYRAELASVYFQNHDWQSAAVACREALRHNPANLDVRKLLVRCQLRLGDRAAARGEFDALMAFDPPDRDELLRWFSPALKTQ